MSIDNQFLDGERISCDKRDKGEFEKCIQQRFMSGSSFRELKNYLLKEGFGIYEYEQDDKANYFYFLWNSNGIGNYRIGVAGNYDEDLTIIHINII
ncbi:hypothetical protein [Synechococcus sp. PCC 7335]|uniref:hypothetical protein n=1 Tax=Synechococcus sp. (strain ATCC 29403 / PCC 7335) TaxID=91464 RepID=UPI0018DB3310|nr:hypothetical protein [Synechococcus sp. PCC 7335]